MHGGGGARHLFFGGEGNVFLVAVIVLNFLLT